MPKQKHLHHRRGLAASKAGNQVQNTKLSALLSICGLHVFGLAVQTWQLAHDSKFSKWMKSRSCIYAYKMFKNVLFTNFLLFVYLDNNLCLVSNFFCLFGHFFLLLMKSKGNCVFYAIITMVSALANYKFKLFLLTELFNFPCMRTQL